MPATTVVRISVSASIRKPSVTPSDGIHSISLAARRRVENSRLAGSDGQLKDKGREGCEQHCQASSGTHHDNQSGGEEIRDNRQGPDHW